MWRKGRIEEKRERVRRKGGEKIKENKKYVFWDLRFFFFTFKKSVCFWGIFFMAYILRKLYDVSRFFHGMYCKRGI